MSVRVQEYPPSTSMPWYRKATTGDGAAAIFIWAAGALATSLVILAIMPDLPWYFAAGFALVTQALLTQGQRRIWRGKPTLTSIGMVIIDVMLNAGGIYPYALRLGNTSPALMIADVFNIPSDVGPIGAMMVAIALGVLIAAAPEELWTKG